MRQQSLVSANARADTDSPNTSIYVNSYGIRIHKENLERLLKMSKQYFLDWMFSMLNLSAR